MALALVTGGAGFIGSHLVRALLARGDRVRVLDDLSNGKLENLSGLEVDFIQADVCDPSVVTTAMEAVDNVYHLAALVSIQGSLEAPLSCYRVNLFGSLNVLWASREARVRKVVLASSSAVYGEASGQVEEAMVVQPISPYAASKLAMEEAAQLFARVYGLAAVSLRYFNVYGPHQPADSPYAAVIPRFIKAMGAGEAPMIYGDGRQTRDFVYVDDVVRANLLAADSDYGAGMAYNVGSGESTTILNLVRRLAELIPGAPEPVFAPPRPADIRHSSADLRRISQTLEYRPEITLQQGLRSTVEWFRRSSPKARR